VANKIAVQYRTPDGKNATTSFYEDTDSSSKFGTKTLIIRARETMSQTAAEQKAQSKLAQLAWPRSVPGDLGPWSGDPGTLDVEVIGLAQTLNWTLYNSTDTTEDDANDAIANMISSAEFVSAGAMEANTTQISRDAEYRPVWDRIVDITELDDSGLNEQWLAAVYGGLLTYYEVDETAINYRRELKGGKQFVKDEFDQIIADPLVRPGQVVFTGDIMAGRSLNSTLRNDPRVSLIEAVQYSADGLRLRRSRLNAGDDAARDTKVALRQMLRARQARTANIGGLQ
jgi:hypothetical protein